MARGKTKDTLGRRSRFKRTPIGKRIFLTDRDTAIMRLLYRYRFLRATQLIAFLKPKSEKRLIERLGDLYHETGLIDRPKAQWRGIDARYTPIIYELTGKGEAHLLRSAGLPLRATALARRGRPGSKPHFEHAMMIVDALASTELEAQATLGQRFVPMDEILARAPEATRRAVNPLRIPVTIPQNKDVPGLHTPIVTHLIPDGLYGIEYLIDGEKLYRFWALECENRSPKWRSRFDLSSLALKRAAYDALIMAGLLACDFEIKSKLMCHTRRVTLLTSTA